MDRGTEGYPHVTAILSRAGLIDRTWWTDYDAMRGKALHAATQYLDEGTLDWSTVDPLVIARLRQYQLFLEQVRPEILAIEEQVVNEALQYQGRLDRRVIIGGREGILDIKSPSRAPWNALQLSMYAACFNRALARWNLYLEDDRYQLVEHKARHDWEAAKAAITLAAWRERNGD